jgi:hypothetical protein
VSHATFPVPASPARVAVWESLAQHFLDNDTRPAIPHSAELCLDAGLSPAEAYNIWRYEVTPVLWTNLWNHLGEWAGWDTAWLVSTIESQKHSRFNQPGRFNALLYRWRIQSSHAVWVAVEACMHALLREPEASRRQLTANLTWLAEHYFDVASPDSPVACAARTSELFHATFLPIFRPLVVPNVHPRESLQLCEERVLAALKASRLQNINTGR